MRKLVAFAVTMIALAGPAAERASADSVTGTAYVTAEQCFEYPPPIPGGPPYVQCFAPNRYIFDAHSGPTGESPHGTVDFVTGERAGLTYDSGSVTCLAVSANRASVGVNFAGPSYEYPNAEPHAAIIFVEDNGGQGQDRVDVQNLPPGASAPIMCPRAPLSGTVLGPTYPRRFTDFTESVTVTDTIPPLPTSKEQCKNGGWKNYGTTFKNQGQCVAFVERGPKP